MTSLTVAAQSWHGRISLRLFDRDMGTASTSYQWDNATREPRMRSLCLPLPALPCLLGGAGLWGPWRRRLGVYRARPRSAAATHRGASALPAGCRCWLRPDPTAAAPRRGSSPWPLHSPGRRPPRWRRASRLAVLRGLVRAWVLAHVVRFGCFIVSAFHSVVR